MAKKKTSSLPQLLVLLLVVAAGSFIVAPDTVMNYLRPPVQNSVGKLAESLWYARHQAGQSGHSVTLCAAKDMGCSSTAGWHDGWLVFVDDNNNREFDAEQEKLLSSNPKLDRRITIASRGKARNNISFAPGGHTINRKGAPESAEFIVCDGDELDDQAIRIQVNFLGVIKTEPVEFKERGQPCR